MGFFSRSRSGDRPLQNDQDILLASDTGQLALLAKVTAISTFGTPNFLTPQANLSSQSYGATSAQCRIGHS
jgi:hypothetical protein